MLIDRKNLIDILGSIKPAIPKKGDDDMLKRVIFTGYDVVAFSEDLIMAWPYETDFATVAPSEELIAILDKLNKKEVTLLYNDGQFNIKSEKVRARLKTEPTSVLLQEVANVLSVANEAQYYEAPAQLGEALKMCMYSASKDTTQKHLMCVKVSGAEVIASDDFRISRYHMDEEFGGDILIPATTCVQMSKYVFNRYALTDNWTFFLTAEDIVLATRNVTEAYDDVSQHLDFEGDTYKLPTDLAERVDQVSILAPGAHDIEKEVVVTLQNGEAIVRAQREIGWAEAKAISEKPEDLTPPAPVAFTVNPIFLIDVLGKTENIIKMNRDRALFTKGNFWHLISLGLPAEVTHQ